MALHDRPHGVLAGIAALSTSCLIVVACMHDTKAKPPAAAPATPSSVSAPAPAPPVVASLVVSDGVREKCGVAASAVGADQPDFEEANLLPRGMGLLDQLADCVRRGALHETGLTIIGNPDPHGPDALNRMLGMERASAAEEYLVRHGVARSSMELRSSDDGGGQLKAAPERPAEHRVVIEERTMLPLAPKMRTMTTPHAGQEQAR